MISTDSERSRLMGPVEGESRRRREGLRSLSLDGAGGEFELRFGLRFRRLVSAPVIAPVIVGTNENARTMSEGIDSRRLKVVKLKDERTKGQKSAQILPASAPSSSQGLRSSE